MLSKLALGVVAAASLAAASLAPTAASAFTVHVGSGWHHHHHHRFYAGPRFYVGTPVVASSCFQRKLVPTRTGLRWRIVDVCAY